MPFRRLSFSRDTRLTALESAHRKLAASSSGIILITNAQGQELDLQNPTSKYSRYKKECADVPPAKAIQVATTALRDQLAHRARLLVVKSILNIQSAIETDHLPLELRSYYQLPPNKDTLPDIVTPADIRLWGANVIAGETARLASTIPAHVGPGPLSWPTVAQVTAALSALENAEAEQLRAKEKADLEDEEATALDAEVDPFIKDMWDTIEFNLRTHEAPASAAAPANGASSTPPAPASQRKPKRQSPHPRPRRRRRKHREDSPKDLHRHLRSF